MIFNREGVKDYEHCDFLPAWLWFYIELVIGGLFYMIWFDFVQRLDARNMSEVFCSSSRREGFEGWGT
jgi:hypothetical protein